MNPLERCMAILLAVAIIAALCVCGSQPRQSPAPEETPAASEPAPQEAGADPEAPAVVTDAAGREVAIPDKAERVVVTCYGGATHEVAVLGAADKVAAQLDMKKFPLILKMFPRFDGLVDPGSFDNVNVEEIMKADPDMVLVAVRAKKGNARLEEAGIPTYTMSVGWADIDTLKQEFTNLGLLLGKREEAEKLTSYWDEKLHMVEEITARVPEEERKSVYYTGEQITAVGYSNWEWNWIRAVNGISAAEETPTGDISVEQALEWNPDVVIVSKGGSTQEILGDDRIQQMTAVKNGEVYSCPIGAFWWDRPSPESPLGFMWLAKTLYPAYTQEIDLKKETKDFYREFYNYKLSDEEYQSFFA